MLKWHIRIMMVMAAVLACAEANAQKVKDTKTVCTQDDPPVCTKVPVGEKPKKEVEEMKLPPKQEAPAPTPAPTSKPMPSPEPVKVLAPEPVKAPDAGIADNFTFIGIEFGVTGRIHSFSPNERRPASVGPEAQILLRITEALRIRGGGGYGYGGESEANNLHAYWILAGLQVKLHPLLSLSFGFDHEQRFSVLDRGAETHYYGGYAEGRLCLPGEEKHHRFCVGYRPGIGAIRSQGDGSLGERTDPSWTNALNLSYAFLP